MTSSQYAVLFRIECLHGYFGGGACRNLALLPTEDCRALLGRYQMLFRPSDAGAAIYARPDILRNFDEGIPFTFSLTSTDPVLDVYTESSENGPINPAENIFYFDNRLSYQATVFGESRTLLHAPGEPLNGAALAVRPKMFSFTPDSSPQNGTLQVLEPLSSQVLWQNPAPRGKPSLLDLRRLPVGHYRLAMDGNELQKFYLSDRPASQQWGAISIFAGGKQQSGHLPSDCQSINADGEPAPKTFTLALESRKVIWRYYIIDPAGKQDFGNYELLAMRKPGPGIAAGQIDFVRLPETASFENRTAWVFESKSPLPFLHAAASEFSMSLRPNGNGTRGDRTLRLPCARPGFLVRKDGPAPQAFCSEIFVYV